MLKLETEAAQRKQARVAESEAKLVRDKQTIAGLEGRQAADQELLAAVNRACSAVEDGAAKRTKIRNELNVALSQTRANQAHARAFSLQQEDADAEALLRQIVTDRRASLLERAKGCRADAQTGSAVDEETEHSAAALQEQLQNADAAAAGLRSALSSGML